MSEPITYTVTFTDLMPAQVKRLEMALVFEGERRAREKQTELAALRAEVAVIAMAVEGEFPAIEAATAAVKAEVAAIEAELAAIQADFRQLFYQLEAQFPGLHRVIG